MPVNIEITDRHIIVKAENGDTIVLNREDGRPETALPIPKTAQAPRATTPKAPALTEVRISPRWRAKVGDTVLGQHKPGGRKFRTTIKAFKSENGSTYAQVSDPRNGGTYLLALDRLTRIPTPRKPPAYIGGKRA